MTSHFISPPGTEYGPCVGRCAHRDCAWMRETAAKSCYLCQAPIGYDQRFYENEGDVAHAVCLEEVVHIAGAGGGRAKQILH